MLRLPALAATSLLFAAALYAPAQSAQPDLAALPSVIKSGAWKSLDTSTLTLNQQCQVLQLLNDSLDELSAKARAQADLMSAYLDEGNLGPQFATSPPPADPSPLTYNDAVKIAAALLAGPLAQSSYATEFAGTTDTNFLNAYQQMFQTSCQRKWSELTESRRQLSWMSAFLKSKDLTKSYEAWVPGEVQRRQQEVAAQAAQRQAAYQARQQAQKQKAQQIANQQNQQLNQQVQKTQAQQQAYTQQQIAAAQQVQESLGSAEQQLVVGGSGAVGVYPGAYGYGDLGAGAWYRDAAYRGAAGAATEARFSSWHAGGFRR